MARIRMTVVMPKRIDKQAYLRDKDSAIFEAIKKAGRAFIQAAWPAIPVRSGMARGSLMAEVQAYRGSGSAISFFNTSVPVTPIEYNKKYYIYPGQRGMANIVPNSFDNENEKRKALGWIPKDEDSGATISHYKITKDGGKFKFIFDSGVRHFNYNEFALNWHSLTFGYEAFNSSMQQSLKRDIPKLTDYMEYVRISGGKATNIQGSQYNRKVRL